MGVVIVQVSGQARDEFFGRCEITALQPATSQGAEPQLDLVEPGAVLGREMKDVLVFEVRQESTSLSARAQVAFVERQSVQSCHEFAHVQTPVGVQVVEDPMKPLLVGELRRDMGQMSGEINAGACHAQIPHDLSRGHHEGGDQGAGAVADVFVLAFLGFARLGQNRGILALEDLHAGLFVAADDQLAVLIQEGSLHVEPAYILSLGVEVGIVAVEPVDAAMRFQVGLVQDAPNGGAMHGFVGVPIDQDDREIIEAPLTGDTVMCAGFARGQRDDFELFVGGKSPVADRTAKHLAGRRGHAAGSGFAIAPRSCDCKPARWRPANWTADRTRPGAKSDGNEPPSLAAWNDHGSAPANAQIPWRPGQSWEHAGEASWHPCHSKLWEFANAFGQLAKNAQTCPVQLGLRTHL